MSVSAAAGSESVGSGGRRLLGAFASALFVATIAAVELGWIALIGYALVRLGLPGLAN